MKEDESRLEVLLSKSSQLLHDTVADKGQFSSRGPAKKRYSSRGATRNMP